MVFLGLLVISDPVLDPVGVLHCRASPIVEAVCIQLLLTQSLMRPGSSSHMVTLHSGRAGPSKAGLPSRCSRPVLPPFFARKPEVFSTEPSICDSPRLILDAGFFFSDENNPVVACGTPHSMWVAHKNQQLSNFGFWECSLYTSDRPQSLSTKHRFICDVSAVRTEAGCTATDFPGLHAAVTEMFAVQS